ncbi:hypothetical protein AB0G05_02150 [Nonomuraea wenchangensis]
MDGILVESAGPCAFGDQVPGGLFRHYWVLFKLVINVGALVVLLMYTETLRYLAGVAAASDAGPDMLRSPSVHAAGGVQAARPDSLRSQNVPRSGRNIDAASLNVRAVRCRTAKRWLRALRREATPMPPT